LKIGIMLPKYVSSLAVLWENLVTNPLDRGQ
jgi:hypothetical protein